MAELPKAAHRTKEQKALGFINAGREGLKHALFWTGYDHPAYSAIEDMIEETYRIEGLFHG